MPNRRPLLCAVSPATALPSDNASSRSNPSHSATTADQSVKTGARLMRIVRVAIGASPIDFTFYAIPSHCDGGFQGAGPDVVGTKQHRAGHSRRRSTAQLLDI